MPFDKCQGLVTLPHNIFVWYKHSIVLYTKNNESLIYFDRNNFCANPVKKWASINCVRFASVQH